MSKLEIVEFILWAIVLAIVLIGGVRFILLANADAHTLLTGPAMQFYGSVK